MRYYWLFVLLVPAVLFSQKTTLLHAERGLHPGIYDQQQRFVLLKGCNYNALGDYWQGTSVRPNMPYNAGDFEEMKSYGLNCVRLVFSWSKLNPRPGVYNYDYINNIRQAIEDAGRNNMYVLLDMHQDAWGKYIVTPVTEPCLNPNKGWDGAPEWATLTDGKPTCLDYNEKTKQAGERESAPAVIEAFENFWINKNGIQDSCINAWRLLIGKTCHYENVLGYDLLNEPNMGTQSALRESQLLAGYYFKISKEIRKTERENGGAEHIIFFEPTISHRGKPEFLFPFPYSRYDRNSVFSPHFYFFTAGSPFSIPATFKLVFTIDKLLLNFPATFISEWGFWGNAKKGLSDFAMQEDKFKVGSTYWVWSSSPGDPHHVSWDGMSYPKTVMQLVETDTSVKRTGKINNQALTTISRPRPMFTTGHIKKLKVNIESGEMFCSVNNKKSGETVLWIPDRGKMPVIQGKNILSQSITKVSGGYYVALHVAGNYNITVSYNKSE